MKNWWNRQWLGSGAIVVATLIAYWPALHAGFIWDDDAYVTSNPLLTEPGGLHRIWFSAHRQSQYVPLVFTTLRLEHALWGLNPFGYHLVNILLHCGNALLVWNLLRRLALPGAWLAAALFAVHPVQVESVAWVTELKNTLSTLFYLLAVRAWLVHIDSPTGRRWKFYGLSLGWFGLALCSKTTTCTLPAALLIVNWLRHGRVSWRRLPEVIPFFVLGVGMGLLAVWWESHLGAYRPQADISFTPLERVLIASHALWFNAGKLIWPTHLCFSYPRWQIEPGNPLAYGWLLGCAAIAVVLGWQWRRGARKTPLAVLFFAATLSPLLGFISLYTFRYTFAADHYQYVACIGLFAVVAAALEKGFSRLAAPRNWVEPVVAGTVLLVLATLAWGQAHVYTNLETLWRDTLAENPSSWLAHNNLGCVLQAQGRLDNAVAEYRETLSLKPDYAEAHYNLANVLEQQGRVDEAIAHYKEALRSEPESLPTFNNLGLALVRQGRTAEAVAVYRQAIRLAPGFAPTHNNLGLALAAQGRIQEAIAEYSAALQFDPAYEKPHYNLAVVLAKEGNTTQAIVHLREALRLKPGWTTAAEKLAELLTPPGARPPTRAQGTTDPSPPTPHEVTH